MPAPLAKTCLAERLRTVGHDGTRLWTGGHDETILWTAGHDETILCTGGMMGRDSGMAAMT